MERLVNFTTTKIHLPGVNLRLGEALINCKLFSKKGRGYMSNQTSINYLNRADQANFSRSEAQTDVQRKKQKSVINKSLKGKFFKVKALNVHQIIKMYQLMNEYYNGVRYDTFIQDLSKKDGAILLLNKVTKEVEGFSTLMYVDTEIDNVKYRGAFSGDTVLNKKYWGQTVLASTFGKHLLRQKLKSPFRPYFWYLISKGYKTYLLMGNNFGTHYPRYEKPTPSFYKKLLSSVYGRMYPDNYIQDKGLIEFFDESTCSLKEKVAPITNDLLKKNKRIAYFNKINKNWLEGTELACVAEMTFLTLFSYQIKAVKKLVSRFKFKKKYQRKHQKNLKKVLVK